MMKTLEKQSTGKRPDEMSPCVRGGNRRRTLAPVIIGGSKADVQVIIDPEKWTVLVSRAVSHKGLLTWVEIRSLLRELT